MRISLPVLTLCFALTFATAAHADPMTGGATGSGGGFSGSGTFYSTDNGDGSFTVTSLTGTNVGDLIGAGLFNSNDNQLFPDADALVDGYGIAFTASEGDTSFDVDIYSPDGTNYYAYLNDSDGFEETIPVTLSISDGDTFNSPTMSHTINTLRENGTVGPEAFSFSIGTPSPTPEPSGLVLLGTGILGTAGAISRRLTRRKN